MLVGNKCDIKEETSVTTQDGEQLVEHWGCQFYGLVQVMKPVEENSGWCVCL